MFGDFFSLLFPRCCLLTGTPLAKGEQFISTHTISKLPKYDLKELNENLHKRFYGLVTVKHAFAYYKFSKNSKVQKLLHHVKYKKCPEIGEISSRWYAYALIEAGYQASFDMIIPVPLHKAKLRQRGYNQCNYIAKGLADVLGIEWTDKVLFKKMNTKSQTKKSRTERFSNAMDVFEIRNADLIKHKRVLLVDDVITTGATIIACSQLLIKGGCKDISVATLATAE